MSRAASASGRKKDEPESVIKKVAQDMNFSLGYWTIVQLKNLQVVYLEVNARLDIAQCVSGKGSPYGTEGNGSKDNII